jgi:hypothetical protein
LPAGLPVSSSSVVLIHTKLSLRVACRMQVYSYFEADMQPQLRTTLDDLAELLDADQGTQQQQQQGAVFLDTRSAAQYTAQVGRSGCKLARSIMTAAL